MALHSMMSRLSGQPDSYGKKTDYKFGRVLGAGTYGQVKEAQWHGQPYAVKIILKKNVKGNEQMIKDELELLQRMHHPNIVRFHDWFESRDKYYIVTNLATGGELFDRICERGRFTERDASKVIHQVLLAVNYLHDHNVVHRDLKPENLLYLTRKDDSDIVLADFGIAKMLVTKDEILTTMAGSFGYTAPEVMMKKGHGLPVDIWSVGVITYTLIGGYSPFRAENIPDLITECTDSANLHFHRKYWKDVSESAKDFIRRLLVVDPAKRPTSAQALQDPWLTGKTATETDILPNIQNYLAKAKLRRAIEKIKLFNRIQALKEQADDKEDMGVPEANASDSDSAISALSNLSLAPPDGSSVRRLSDASGTSSFGSGGLTAPMSPDRPRSRGANIFQAVVQAKIKDAKDQAETEKIARGAGSTEGSSSSQKEMEQKLKD